MKKKVLYVLSLIIVMIGATSCTKENTYRQLIIGPWSCIDAQELYYKNGTLINSLPYEEDEGAIYEFTSDGKMLYYYAYEDEYEVFDYTLHGSTLTIFSPDDIDFTIDELGQSTMTLTSEPFFHSDHTYYHVVKLNFERIAK